jgi:hypothetical protein
MNFKQCKKCKHSHVHFVNIMQQRAVLNSDEYFILLTTSYLMFFL